MNLNSYTCTCCAKPRAAIDWDTHLKLQAELRDEICALKAELATRTPSTTASTEGEVTAEEIAAHDATRYYGRLQGAEDALLACYIAMGQSAKASMNGGSDWRTLETVAKRKMVAEAVALWGWQKLPATPTPSASTEGEAWRTLDDDGYKNHGNVFICTGGYIVGEAAWGEDEHWYWSSGRRVSNNVWRWMPLPDPLKR